MKVKYTLKLNVARWDNEELESQHEYEVVEFKDVGDDPLVKAIVDCEVRGGILDLQFDESDASRQTIKALHKPAFTIFNDESYKNSKKNTRDTTVLVSAIAEIMFANETYTMVVVDNTTTSTDVNHYVFKRVEKTKESKKKKERKRR